MRFFFLPLRNLDKNFSTSNCGYVLKMCVLHNIKHENAVKRAENIPYHLSNLTLFDNALKKPTKSLEVLSLTKTYQITVSLF